MKVEFGSRLVIMITSIIFMGIGIYFIFFRPPLLPEDLIFMKMSPHIQDQVPELKTWLKNVFTVLGGFALTVGFLKFFLVQNTPSNKLLLPAIVAWTTSIGVMSFINFRIHSDFRWALLLLATFELLGIGGLCISVIQKNRKS